MLLHTFEVAVRWVDNVSSSNYFDRFIKSHKHSQYSILFTPGYEEPNGGKYLCKKNTFNDFVDVARFLVEEWTTPDKLSCEGRSAGGLLIGASSEYYCLLCVILSFFVPSCFFKLLTKSLLSLIYLLLPLIVNQAPELFKCAILGVPFVDVSVTMTDSTIPLTSGEWVEWGNVSIIMFTLHCVPAFLPSSLTHYLPRM